MAESFKEKFDDHLKCGVCLDQYTDPKTLPCYHSFCLECIDQFEKDRQCLGYFIRCPSCRVDHLLPQGGANSLPSDFKINSLLDLHDDLVATQNARKTICPKHNDPLVVYCETCCQVICRDCTISKEHNKHDFELISECYPKHHRQILGNLEVVERRLADMNTAMTHLDTNEKEVLEEGDKVKEQINTHAQQLIDNIQRSRTHLTQQVDTIVQQKTQTLATQRQQAQKLHTQLKTCQDKIEQSLKEWNQQQILTQKKTMMNEMNTATQHVDPAVFQPIEDAKSIVFQHADVTEAQTGTVNSSVYDKAILQASPSILKQPSIATLTLHSQDGSPFSLPPSLISSTLSSPGNKHSTMKCPITQTQPGKYSIAFTPSTVNDQLIVQVGGVDVPDSPFTLPVMTKPQKVEPISIIGGLDNPHGIAMCMNGDIVVAETGAHRITIFNIKRERVKSFGTWGMADGTFMSPRGVAVSNDGHILVTDNHRLQKLTTDGVCVKAVGSLEIGRGLCEFSDPQGIAVHPTTGHVFVTDNGNSRIQVFDKDLASISTFAPGILYQFSNPCDIAIDNGGYLYVAGCNNIYKLTVKGMVVKRFGFSSGQLSCPASLAMHNNLLSVCERGKSQVSVFDTEGNLKTKHKKKLNHSHGIAMDTFGNIYVSEADNGRIIVINKK